MKKETSQLLEFVTLELLKAGFILTTDVNRVAGLDFLITAPTGRISELHLRSIKLDEQPTIKIQKLGYGNVAPHRFLGVVTEVENVPIALYIIPSKTFTTADNHIYYDFPMEMMPHLGYWEINVNPMAIPELSNFEISNFYTVA